MGIDICEANPECSGLHPPYEPLALPVAESLTETNNMSTMWVPQGRHYATPFSPRMPNLKMHRDLTIHTCQKNVPKEILIRLFVERIYKPNTWSQIRCLHSRIL